MILTVQRTGVDHPLRVRSTTERHPGYASPIEQIASTSTDSRRFAGRLADTVRTLASEIASRHCPPLVRVRRLFAIALAGLTQLFDRGRILVILLPLSFDRSLEFSARHGFDSLLTAAAAGTAVGLVFFTWGWLVGRSFHWSLREYPNTTAAFLENHPAAVGVISTAIDGFPKDATEYERLNGRFGPHFEFGPYAHKSSPVAKLRLAIIRGAKTAFIFGTTAHVGIATINGFSPLAVRTRIWVVALEAAVILASIAVVVSLLVSHDFLGVAQRIRDIITDRRILITTSVVVIVASALDNYVRRRRITAAAI